MSRPVGADGEETRERILRAVMDEIGEVGLANLTLKGVAFRAEISIGLLSHHFKSREQLLKETSDDWMLRLFKVRDEVTAIYKSKDSPEESLLHAMVACMNIGRQHTVPMKMLMRSVVVHGKLPVGVSSVTFPLGDQIAKMLAEAHGVSFERARASVHQAAVLMVRLGLCSEHELTSTYGSDAETAWKRCCRHAAATILVSLSTASEEALALFDELD